MALREVFVDTSAWYAVAVPADRCHPRAAALFRELLEQRATLITSDYVLDETLTRLRYDTTHADAVAFWRGVVDAQAKGHLRIERVDEAMWAAAIVLFERFSDTQLSVTDCSTLAISGALGLGEVFAFDSHLAMTGMRLVPGK